MTFTHVALSSVKSVHVFVVLVGLGTQQKSFCRFELTRYHSEWTST